MRVVLFARVILEQPHRAVERGRKHRPPADRKQSVKLRHGRKAGGACLRLATQRFGNQLAAWRSRDGKSMVTWIMRPASATTGLHAGNRHPIPTRTAASSAPLHWARE